MITLTIGHFESLHVRRDDGREAIFPGRIEDGRWKRIITGARDIHGQCLVMGSLGVRRFYRVTPRLQKLGDTMEIEDDKGLFGRITADDILRHSKRAHGIMPVSVGTLAKAATGQATQRRRKS